MPSHNLYWLNLVQFNQIQFNRNFNGNTNPSEFKGKKKMLSSIHFNWIWIQCNWIWISFNAFEFNLGI